MRFNPVVWCVWRWVALWADSGPSSLLCGESNLDACVRVCAPALSAVPPQSAPANWLLWEPHRATHPSLRTHTRPGPPSHLLGLAPTGSPLLLLSEEMLEVPPAVPCYQQHGVVSCHPKSANLHWLILCTDSQPELSAPPAPSLQAAGLKNNRCSADKANTLIW